MIERISELLERFGIRCRQCGKFGSKKSLERKLEWGTNFGNVLLMDPFYLITVNYTCGSCDHLMHSRVTGSEPA